jgi:Uma2 family endonuclease
MKKASTQPEILSIDAYLEGELAGEVRHEYLGGHVYAMVGASDIHNLVSMNLAATLHQHLRDGPCQVFMSDMKVRLSIAADDIFYYPDVLVSCREDDRARYWREHPCLIVEILSEGTARIDRREKFLAYQQIDMLEEYLLVEQDEPWVTLFRRGNGWQPERLGPANMLRLASVALDMPVAEIYRGTELALDQ